MTLNEQIVEAVKKGDTNLVIKLLSDQPQLINTKTAKGESLVLLAVYYGKPEVLEIFSERDYALDVYEAAATGNTIRAGELINEEPELLNSFSPDGFTPIGLASFFGYKELVDLLISLGANINIASKNDFKVMPLHSSVAARNIQITSVLLENGANVDAKQQADYTPLHHAVQNGDLEMVKLLLKYNPDRGAKTADGKTAAALASEKKHQGIIALLQQ
jgi:ankyrin repeat protein